MLDLANLDPEHLIGIEPVRNRRMTLEKLAVNAVMAGCLRDHFPLVCESFSAMLKETFLLHGAIASTGGCAVLVVINGPVREQLGMCGTFNVLIRDFFGDAPFQVSREGTVHVAAVNRGGPFSGLERRVVHRWNQNQPSPDLLWVDCSGQVEQRDRAFVFIFVISPGEESRRSLAVINHADGNHH